MSAPSDPWVLELANLTDDELADPAIVMASDPRQAAMYRRWVRASRTSPAP